MGFVIESIADTTNFRMQLMSCNISIDAYGINSVMSMAIDIQRKAAYEDGGS
jgi:hypothetical protein